MSFRPEVRKVLVIVSSVALLAAMIGGGWALNRRAASAASAAPPVARETLVELSPDTPAAIRLASSEAVARLGVTLAPVRDAAAAEPLQLAGTLSLDPSRMLHVHSRFTGEIVSLGQIEENGQKRALRYGDRVKKGQVLAVIWSKEVGEKKSELVDALSGLHLSESLLKRLESLQAGVVAERTIVEARREVEADLIAVARAERTLRSWRITDAEIDAIRAELATIRSSQPAVDPARQRLSTDRDVTANWANIEVRAAIDGAIVEKNYNVGDIVEPDDDLFKIADLSRLQVLANVYEEDLWEVRRLAPEMRHWRVQLKSDPAQRGIDGKFELISSVIDPAQRTGVLMGWIDNSDGRLAIGQFVTATIQLVPNPAVVVVPATAVIEEGDSTTVFVETDSALREFARREVVVVRRSASLVFIDSSAKGGNPLRAGERVVVSGALGVGGELSNLLAARQPSESK
ncbi:MAG: efflux RND transporter periplasmic adaptor subunit [Pirellulaceae bacterium]|nr:efflux RND transporter periplasmic adaptor subunit [Pirellulaceae bacterium]